MKISNKRKGIPYLPRHIYERLRDLNSKRQDKNTYSQLKLTKLNTNNIIPQQVHDDFTDLSEIKEPVPITGDYEFDLQRLSNEVNSIHADVMKHTIDNIGKGTEEFKKRIGEEQENYFQIVEKKTEEELEDFKKQSDVILKEKLENIKEELIREYMSNRSTIVIPGQPTVAVPRSSHPMLERVFESLFVFRKVLLTGPAGTGKTTMAKEMADMLKLPFYKYSCSRDSSVHDLIGYKQPKSETYLETTFLNAYENGGVFLVDEYDAMTSDVSLFFNGVADNSDFISVPHRDDKPNAFKHKDFYLIFCGNTWGKGSHEYVGRDFQDQALLDRFRVSKFYIDYHVELEKNLTASVGLDYNKIINLRRSLVKVNSYLSTRNVEDLCKMYRLKLSHMATEIESQTTEANRDAMKYNIYKIVVKGMTEDLSDQDKQSLYGDILS